MPETTSAPPSSSSAHRELRRGRKLATELPERRERRLEQDRPPDDLHLDVVAFRSGQARPVLREALLLLHRALDGEIGGGVGVERFARAHHHFDRAVLQDARGARPSMLERRRLARDLRGEGALAPAEIVELLLPEPERRRADRGCGPPLRSDPGAAARGPRGTRGGPRCRSAAGGSDAAGPSAACEHAMGDHRHVRDARRDLACARRTPNAWRSRASSHEAPRADRCSRRRSTSRSSASAPTSTGSRRRGRSSQRGSRVLSSRRRNAAVGGRAGGTAARDRHGAGRRHADRGVGAARPSSATGV